jgi:hypothetical protein
MQGALVCLCWAGRQDPGPSSASSKKHGQVWGSEPVTVETLRAEDVALLSLAGAMPGEDSTLGDKLRACVRRWTRTPAAGRARR